MFIYLIACPNHCTTCSSNSQCQTCELGYGLVNNLCSSCLANQYLNGQACLGN